MGRGNERQEAASGHVTRWMHLLLVAHTSLLSPSFSFWPLANTTVSNKPFCPFSFSFFCLVELLSFRFVKLFTELSR